jgi:hypothetical protein
MDLPSIENDLPGIEDHVAHINVEQMALDGAQLRDDAIARVEANADPAWKALAYDAVIEVARTHVTFTTDEVWFVLAERNVRPPHEPRAMGAVMQRAKREKVVRATPEFRETTRPQAHCAPVRVWESLVKS